MTNVLDHVHTKATRTSSAEMARRLQELLGQRAVAFACDVRSPKSVGHWIAGTKPGMDAARRLSALFQAVLVLDDEDDDTKVAWLTGSNPGLDDLSPLEVIRNGHGPAVVRAAEAFVNNS